MIGEKSGEYKRASHTHKHTHTIESAGHMEIQATLIHTRVPNGL